MHSHGEILLLRFGLLLYILMLSTSPQDLVAPHEGDHHVHKEMLFNLAPLLHVIADWAIQLPTAYTWPEER